MLDVRTALERVSFTSPKEAVLRFVDMCRPIAQYRNYMYPIVGVWRRCGRLPNRFGHLFIVS